MLEAFYHYTRFMDDGDKEHVMKPICDNFYYVGVRNKKTLLSYNILIRHTIEQRDNAKIFK